MASKNNAITCKIFLGFGGSGAKTLVELARMFAADKEWAERCESEAYFLLADTDIDDLEKHLREIRTALAEVGAHSWVRSVQLSEGVPRIDRLITDRMKVAKASEKGLQRMKECWWFDPDGRPFMARNVQLPPSEGAAQCPAISYFLSWNSIGGDSSPVGQRIDELCNEMQARVSRQHGAQDFDVKLYLVAGLAGGTGRGSWAVLSFGIQAALQARGRTCMPIGMFFDQSCFRDVAQDTQGQRVKLAINSLTGISELAGWIENDLDRESKGGKSKRFIFQLPSFSSPDRTSNDVLNAGMLTGDADQAGAAPVRQAFLIFAEGAAGELKPGEQYKVAASALYARTAQSAIESEQSNTRLSIGSVGASSYRVNVHGIRDYLKKWLEYASIKRFAEGADKKSTAEIVDAIMLPLLADAQADKGRRGADDSADQNMPQLLARIHKAALSATAQRVDEFLENLEAADIDEYEDAVSRLAGNLGKESKFLTGVSNAVRESIRHVHGERLLPDESCSSDALFVSYLSRAMRSTLEHPTEKGAKLDAHVHSFAVAQQVLEALCGRCKDIEDRFHETKSSTSAADVAALARKLSGRKFKIAGKRFEEDELPGIRSLAEQYVLSQARASVAKVFAKWSLNAVRSLQSWRDNLEDSKERALHHAVALEKHIDSVATDELFTVEKDFQDAAKPLVGQSHFHPDRYLEPYLEKDQLEHWMRELAAQRDDRLTEELTKISKHVLGSAYATEGSGKIDESLRKEIRRELGKRLEELHTHVVIPPDFLHRHFRLGDVAEKLVHAWANRIEKAASNPRAQENLKRRFLHLFGFELALRNGQCDVPSKKEIIGLMALRLGQNCRAQFLVRSGSGMAQNRAATHVFLPTDSTLAKGAKPTKEWEDGLGARAAQDRRHRIKFKVGREGEEEGDERGNPFLMLACVVEGFTGTNADTDPTDQGAIHQAFDSIASLDYWRASNDPHVKTFLQWVEDPSGRSMFADVEYSFGLGYTVPAFVTNEQLRRARWRPWAIDTEQRLERQGGMGVDTLLYALLGSDGKRSSALLQLQVKNEDGETSDWTLPLLLYGKAKDSKHGFGFARRAFTKETGDWRPMSKAFRAGEEETSIKKLMTRFKEDEALRRALASEAHHFFGTLAMEEGLRDRDVQRLFVALHDWLDGDFRSELDKLSIYELEYRDRVEQLVERALQLSKLSRAELAEHFKG
jgi:hypothetical protein